ncbi:MAG: RNA methyltransferase [Cyclobacteriaceae bacterium]|nr:RNA methyltransferase [Cyclobacteriaceae bacterium]
MISKQEAKFVKSLKLKKYRRKAESFLVEGAKNVLELLGSDYQIQSIYVTRKFMDEYGGAISGHIACQLCTEQELADLGTFQTNEYALAIASMKMKKFEIDGEKLVIALDEVSDPGNLGTIIRIADWYGVTNILASHGTADFYNPKVINASMGSFTRVGVHYISLEEFIEYQDTHQVYGAFLEGENIHNIEADFPAILLMGNESQGINSRLEKLTDRKITIPRFGNAESLNVAVSTAILCDNLLRH